ncbi:c-type cytochrome biogenesis protein CcmI [Caenimonas koreensis DSM 17982]|uniref:C-type cytochrome biogenesis protein CcmI n=1 Tax=Caenimonas koreensis DSM 17982 TaxID=1121255 RepID=A0A844AV10_9BURK|nr:c-type cytochrome biogenesis protein CcmI [Caenimonas koreensis]MRD47934.1 c-type cytochrome biogenesis protein CcmI [Caenimonas koreensis DSM 17982]
MIEFVLIAAIAVAVVLLLVLRPFFWQRAQAGPVQSQRRLNAQIYREQMERLDADLAAGTLAQSEYAETRAELQRRALDDTQEEDAALVLKTPRRTMLAVAFVLPVAAAALYAVIGTPAALSPQATAPAAAATPDMQQIEQMVAGLAKKLEADPSNLKGWAMLGQSYKVMGRNAEAEKAFDKAGAFLEGDAALLASYADVAASNAGGSFKGKPAMLIDKALKVNPAEPMALWLAGTVAMRDNDNRKALAYWQQLLPLLAPGSQDEQMLRGIIEEVRAKAGDAPGTAVAAATPQARPAAAATTPAASVTGTVTLDASLKSRLAAGDTLMVIARVPGTRMPVAVLRVPAAGLPMPFTLDDSLSMSPQALLSSAKEVEIEARISKSGQARAEPGDLISTVQTVKVGARGVTLAVASVRP